MLPSLTRVMERLLLDYLPGGKWDDVENDLKENLKATPKHSKSSETVFGQLDRLLREKSNISLITSEAMLSFCNNRTMEWLQNKDEIERKEICSGRRLRKSYQHRLHIIREETRRKLNEKLAEEAAKEERKIQKMESHVNGIQIWGLWQSQDEVISALSILKTKKDKISALKTQLLFRKNVFHQKVDDQHVYSFSKKVGEKRENLSVQELQTNVMSLVNKSLCAAAEKTDKQVPVIVGKKVQHTFTNTDGKITWYNGQIISQVPGYGEWFNIKYCGDATIYKLEDLRRGDLRVQV